MEKWGSRRHLQEAAPNEGSRTIVELQSRRQLRQAVNELIQLTLHSPLTRHDLQQQLHSCITCFGPQYGAQLVHSLRYHDHTARQAIVWLLTLLNDQDTIPLLQHMALNIRLSRSVRLSASLALAGMGATRATIGDQTCIPSYA